MDEILAHVIDCTLPMLYVACRTCTLSSLTW